MEKNPIAECNKIQKKYYPELFAKFSEGEWSSKSELYRLSSQGHAGNHVLQMHRWNFKKTASVSMTAMEEFCICRTMPVM